ncbi:MAG: hypothetical protein ACP5T3_03685, partial [Candidatus Micrarchaeia archaeon]
RPAAIHAVDEGLFKPSHNAKYLTKKTSGSRLAILESKLTLRSVGFPAHVVKRFVMPRLLNAHANKKTGTGTGWVVEVLCLNKIRQIYCVQLHLYCILFMQIYAIKVVILKTSRPAKAHIRECKRVHAIGADCTKLILTSRK